MDQNDIIPNLALKNMIEDWQNGQNENEEQQVTKVVEKTNKLNDYEMEYLKPLFAFNNEDSNTAYSRARNAKNVVVLLYVNTKNESHCVEILGHDFSWDLL